MGQRDRRRATGVALGAGLCAAMAVLSVTVFTPSGAQTANAGLSVVTQQDAGTVSLVDATGKVTPYASKLQAPRGVATLPDGSVLVAEYGASRVVGLGGRFGTETTAIATVQTPDGLAVASDGSVYVTSLLGGELGRLDLERKTFARVSQGLKGPSQIAVRGDAVLVAESTGGDVVSVPRTGGGTKTVVAKGFQQPVGVAPTPDGGLLVADFAANKILKVDASGASADFVTIDQPVELALDPPAPAAGQAWSVVVASAQAGVVRFDQTGARVGNRGAPAE